MRLWPFGRTTFDTSLGATEAIDRLHAEIGPNRLWVIVGPFNASVRADTDRRMFLGRQLRDGGRFYNNLNTEPGELRKVNAFQALVRARVTPSANGSTVSASYRMRSYVLAFYLMWCVPFAWTDFAVGGAILRGEATSPWSLLIGPAFIIGTWLGISFVFSEDVDTADRMLRATLERE